MSPDWLAKYPRAAAFLQRADDVLLYEPLGDWHVAEMWRPDWEARIRPEDAQVETPHEEEG